MASSFWNLFSSIDPDPAKKPSPLWNFFANPEPDTFRNGPPHSKAAYNEPPPSPTVFNPGRFFWALRDLPLKEATQHMACMGTVGSGKTTLIRLFLQSIAPRFRPDWPGPPEQLIIFDPKFEAVPMLAGMGLHPDESNVYIFNPHDERSAYWNMAKSAQLPLLARHLAALLVPEEPQSSAPYFASSARDMLYAVILGLNRAKPEQWTFRDLICAFDSKERVLSLSKRDPRGAVIAQRIFQDERHAFGVLSSLATKLVQYEPVAALWHSGRSGREFSISKFLSEPGVLVLGGDSLLEDTLTPLNALVMKALQQTINSGEEVDRPRRWFVLDEFAKMGKIPCIEDLLRMGRSKGVSVLLGVHGIESVTSTYKDQQVAETILGLCTYNTFLRASSPGSAEYAERYFGNQRTYETVVAESWGNGQRSVSYTTQLKDRPIFLSTLFKDLPLPGPGKPFFAISDVPCDGCTYVSRRWFDDLIAMQTKDANVPKIIPRDNLADQSLAPWEPEEIKDFCGTLEQGEESKRKPRKRPKKTEGDDNLPDPR